LLLASILIKTIGIIRKLRGRLGGKLKGKLKGKLEKKLRGKLGRVKVIKNKLIGLN